MYSIAVFVSGRGSNLKAVHEFFREKPGKVIIRAVISNKPDCAALEFAKENQIKTFVVSSKEIADRVTFNQLKLKLQKLDIDLVVLAGFLKKIPDDFVDEFQNRIVNIHPALLPSFGGAGMYGMNVHKAVFEKSCKVSGVTVHFVNKIYDDGLIIAQKAVDIGSASSPEEIASTVLKEEHKLLPWVINKFAEGKVSIVKNRVIVE